MGVTLQQIADMAGVHKSTVDKVLHDRPGVSEQKRREIRKLLKENHYESNPLAKALNYQKKKLKIAVILPKVEAAAELKQGMRIVEQDFNNFNIQVDYYSVSYDPEDETRCLGKALEEKVAGVIIVPIESIEVADSLKELNKAGIPVVLVNSDVKNVPRLCYVGEDVEKSGRVMARMMQLWMRDTGQIGIISTEFMQTTSDRERYFLQYLSDRKMKLQYTETETVEENAADIYQAAKVLLKDYPDVSAIYVTCGWVEYVCKAVEEAGKTQQVLVFCYERYPSHLSLMREGKIACCLNPNLFEQGRIGMRLLFEYIVYEKKPDRDRYYTADEIMLRENI